ncbi:uncharacterized protein PpBr36_06482 [Pyricularia pennisetigena]|uniref:uncharacterized protein n=1 Tax=Pyricularia pennisetigena TaxID=1578925 RepID=UPI0011549078|nr:uncharacterized protein PpBr36_06482 [Pyricularia pennisetigena]TLS23248.1 hypothetical protein PpBr36_06482 [Pyricularia pennisetigena]
MAPGILERIQAKIELFRLEQRYTKRRNRRSTFVSNAMYVDGEYIYNTPASTGSSTNSTSTSPSKSATVGSSYTTDNVPSGSPTHKAGKKLNRFSSMPGFGSMSKISGSRQADDWRRENVSVAEVR